MRSFILSFLLLTPIAAIAQKPSADLPVTLRPTAPGRWLPESCARALELGHGCPTARCGGVESDEASWNRFYLAGIEAFNSKDLETAEQSFCRALAAARSFGPRDIRFAETLDELGLVKYLKGDDDGAEAMQGAAVAEMLLAAGPPGEDLLDAAERSCESSVATYTVRLGWIYDRQGRERAIEPLLEEPYRILGKAYIPYDSMVDRLDWLISQYILIEDFAAADWLASLRDET